MAKARMKKHTKSQANFTENSKEFMMGEKNKSFKALILHQYCNGQMVISTVRAAADKS